MLSYISPSEGCSEAVLSCIMYAVTFLGSIHLIAGSRARHTDLNIQKRIVGTFIACTIIVTHIIVPSISDLKHSLSLFRNFKWSSLYITFQGILPSLFWTLVSTEVFYFGEWFDDFLNMPLSHIVQPRRFLEYISTHLGFRAIIFAPITEEFVFRACIMYHMKNCYPTDSFKCCVFTALIFSIAHLHHILEDWLDGATLFDSFMVSFVQSCYTLLFGTYAAYLMLKTGNLASAVLVHMLCNLHGLPGVIDSLVQYKHTPNKLFYQGITLAAYCWGVLGWFVIIRDYAFADMSVYPNGS